MNLEFDSSISIKNVYATGVITGATLCGTTICGISKIFEGGSCLASLYLGIAACACDSKCLGAKLPAYYLNTGSTALCATTAGNALCLGAKVPAYYLNTGSTALCATTAGNALCLDGKLPAYYLNTGSTTNGQQTKFSVTQASHGLSVGNVIKSNGANTYVKATGNTAVNAEVVGIVTVVSSINAFTFVTHGIIETGVPVQSSGTVMFLSPTSGGALTTTEPITIGQISKPLMVILESGSKALFQIFRGMIITADGSYAPLDSPVFTTKITTPVIQLTTVGARTVETAIAYFKSDGTIVSGTSTGGGTWGSITGTLSTQTDLQTCLNGKLASGGTAICATSAINSKALCGCTPVCFLGVNATAVCATCAVGAKSLCGCIPSCFLGATACACDTAKFNNQLPAYYLNTGSTITCALDSAKLNNKLPAYYLNTGSTAVCATCAIGAKNLCGCVPASFLLSGGTAVCATCAGNASTVAGCTPSCFLGVNATAVCATCAIGAKNLCGCVPASFLLSGGTAVNSSKLGGQLPAYYLNTGSTALCSTSSIDSKGLCGCVPTCFLGVSATAVCATCAIGAKNLCGCVPASFLLSGGTALCATTAGNSLKLGNVLPAGYLLSGGTAICATNSACLNGHTEAALSVCNAVCVNGHAEANLSVANSACLGGVLAACYAPKASPVFVTCATLPTPFKIGAVQVNATGTVINYLTGATSNIQTQINTKAPLDSPVFTTKITTPVIQLTTVGARTVETAIAYFKSDGTIVSGTSTGGGTWGSITGTLSTQTDLQTCFNSKLASGGTAVCATCAGNALSLGGNLANTYAPLASPSFTTCTCAPIVCATTCFVGSGAGLTGTAASLSIGGSAGSVSSVIVSDTRATVTTPQTIDKSLVVFDFKQNVTESLSDGGTFHGQMTFRQYADWTGGNSHQLGFTDNGNLWHRTGANTTWGAWGQILQTCGGNVGIGISAGCTPLFSFQVAEGFVKTDTSLRHMAFFGSCEINSNPWGLRFSICGAAAIGNRIAQLQTTEVSLADNGNIALQPAGGNVSIGIAGVGTAKLWVVGCVAIGQNTNGIAIIDACAGFAYYGLNAATCGMCIGAGGAAGFLGNVTTPDVIAGSDRRLKKCIEPIINALSTVMHLQGVSYIRCSDETNEKQIGLIAQDTLNVLPMVVSCSKAEECDFKYGICDIKYGIKYDKIVAVLIEAMKEQQTQINCLCSELTYIKDSKFYK